MPVLYLDVLMAVNLLIDFLLLSAAARILSKYAADSKGKFSIKAGFVEGKVLDVAGVGALAKLPTKEVLLATVLGTLNAPIAAFARVINAIAEKKGAEEGAPAAEAAAE